MTAFHHILLLLLLVQHLLLFDQRSVTVAHAEDDDRIQTRRAAIHQHPTSPLSDHQEEESANVCLSSDELDCPELSEEGDDDDDNDDKSQHRSTVLEFFGVFRKLGVSWTHILKSYRRVIGEAGGRDKKGDVFADDMDEALTLLQDMSKDMSFDLVIPLFPANHTVDDLLRAFLTWSVTNGAKADTTQCGVLGGINGRHDRINVSKAYRRLEFYTSWMKEGERDLREEPLTAESVREAWDAFAMQVTYDSCDRVVWWLDLHRTDMARIKQLRPGQVRRFFVWFAHKLLFDDRAQENGIVFVNSLAGVSFWTFMTMLPLELGIKTDEFMICVIPLNTRLVLFLDRPAWCDFGYRLLKVFLRRDMRLRVVMVKQNRVQETLEEVVGKEYVIKGFDGLEGRIKADLMQDKEFS